MVTRFSGPLWIGWSAKSLRLYWRPPGGTAARCIWTRYWKEGQRWKKLKRMREHKNKKREVLLKMSFLFSSPLFSLSLSTIQFYPVSKLRVTGGGGGGGGRAEWWVLILSFLIQWNSEWHLLWRPVCCTQTLRGASGRCRALHAQKWPKHTRHGLHVKLGILTLKKTRPYLWCLKVAASTCRLAPLPKHVAWHPRSLKLSIFLGDLFQFRI